MKYKLTICTPSYNRGYILSRLYEDLKNQTFKSFEWLIIDDGSTDNTRELVKCWIDENILDIKYIYKNNGGKHTAVNLGIDNAKGELFFIVDSDDGLDKNSLKIINDEWEKKESKSVKGIIGLCVDNNYSVIGTNIPKDIKEASITDLYRKYGMSGDKSIIFTTELMKKYKFPEAKGVKFVAESTVWDNISKKYNVKCINKPMIVREYLDDGLTKNSLSKTFIDGEIFSHIYYINNNIYEIKKYPTMWIKKYVNLARFSFLNKQKSIKKINLLSKKLIYMLFLPLGFLFYLKTKLKIRN